MGVEKFRRPVLAPGYRTFNPYGVTSTGTVLPVEGIATLNAATDKTFRLPAPRVGANLVVTAVDSTSVLAVTTLTTAATFYNSTKQTISFSTAADRKVAELVGVGTPAAPKWMLKFATTGATVS
jgi:hypothetical protein